MLLQYAAERWAFTPRAAPIEPGLVVIGTPDMPGPDTLSALFTEALAATE